MMSRRYVGALLLLAACAATVACRTTGGSGVRVLGGQRDEAAYPATAGVLLINDVGVVVGVCSGTFVTPSRLLTAGHCVGQKDVVTYRIAMPPGSTLAGAPGVPETKEWHRAPGYLEDGDTGLPSHDVALLVFPVDVAARSANIAVKSPRVDDKVTLVGYGCDAVPGDVLEQCTGVGERRLGTNFVASLVANQGNAIVVIRDPPSSPAADYPNNATALPGDSGGGLYDRAGDLAGVVSSNRLRGRQITSIFVNLSNQEVQAFLRSQGVERRGDAF